MIICDFHLHVYPCYNSSKLLERTIQQLEMLQGEIESLPTLGSRRLANGSGPVGELAFVGCLVERYDCQFFAEASQLAANRGVIGQRALNPCCSNEWSVFANAEPCSLRLQNEQGKILHLINGRQIVSQERLEILAWGVEPRSVSELRDGLPAETLIERITASGALPVINWAPGKWSGQRGALVGELIDRAVAGELFLCETSLRASSCAPHRLFQQASERGLMVLFGSDPLPFAGEERSAGSYATLVNGSIDPERPALGLKRALRAGVPVFPLGTHRSISRVVYRLLRNECERRFSKRY